MKLKLPELITLNEYIKIERGNRYLAAKKKKELTELVIWETKRQKIAPVDKIHRLIFFWEETDKRRDPDNISFGAKMILDGMVKAGIFPTDSWKLWIGTPKIYHEYEVAKERGVIVFWE